MAGASTLDTTAEETSADDTSSDDDADAAAPLDDGTDPLREQLLDGAPRDPDAEQDLLREATVRRAANASELRRSPCSRSSAAR